jgi:hypothetical protein
MNINTDTIYEKNFKRKQHLWMKLHLFTSTQKTVVLKKISQFDAYLGSADPDRICVSL